MFSFTFKPIVLYVPFSLDSGMVQDAGLTPQQVTDGGRRRRENSPSPWAGRRAGGEHCNDFKDLYLNPESEHLKRFEFPLERDAGGEHLGSREGADSRPLGPYRSSPQSDIFLLDNMPGTDAARCWGLGFRLRRQSWGSECDGRPW